MIKYRATFRGPRGALNPLSVPIEAEIMVEVFPRTKTGKTFSARTLTPGGAPFRTLLYVDSDTEINGTAENVKAQVRQMFDERLTPWRELEHVTSTDVAARKAQGNMFEAPE